jgi:hypothetical protein
MLRFHVVVHRANGEQPAALAVTFEQSLAALEKLPRLFVEPDGSFVWAQCESDGRAWQVEGNLIDQGATLAHVEMSGECPSEALDALLAALGWPESKLLFQLPRRGAFLEEGAFREAAAAAEGAI